MRTSCDGASFTWSGGVDADLRSGLAVTAGGRDRMVSIRHLTGSRHDDVLRGNGRNNFIAGYDGSDVIRGRGGSDRLHGDRYQGEVPPARNATFADRIYGGSGDDRVRGGSGNDVLEGGAGHDVLRGNADSMTIWMDGVGPAGDRDTLRGNAGQDLLMGGPRADLLLGGRHHDEADGQRGTDTCTAEVERSCEADLARDES